MIKRMIIGLWALVMLVGLAVSAPDVRAAQKTAEWTVLVHLAVDNNLDFLGPWDVNMMEFAGSTDEVNIVVQVDRSAEYNETDDVTEARRYLIQHDEDQNVIQSTLVESLGEVNSGDADTVADFAIWGITNYPAEKYMFVMMDHGGAWISNSSDEDTGDDISLLELRDLLDRVVTETGIGRFEVMGFDMCLMGQLEVFQTIAPYARYGIGSEENEPAPGWFYVFLDELVKNPALSGEELGVHVVDYYMTFFDEYNEWATLYGLGVVDLGQIGGVTAALDQLVAAVEANPEAALSAIADARNNTRTYGAADDPAYADVWSSVDLYQFAELLSGISTVPEVQQAANGLMAAIDQFVIHENHSEPLDGSHGLSIYFPGTRKAYKLGANNESYPLAAPASMAAWVGFLDMFHGTAETVVTAAPTVFVISTYPPVANIHQPLVVTLEIAGRDILQVNYAVTRIVSENERVVLDFDYLVSRTTTTTGADIVDWSNGLTTRTFLWNAEVPMFTDGQVSTYALLIPNRDDPNSALVNGEYTPAGGGDPVPAQLMFDLVAKQSGAVWGINETASGAMQPYEIQYAAGDQFRPLWLTLDANNELSATSFGDVLRLDPDQPITYEKVPAPSGDYSISFVAENVAGKTTLDEAPVRVENENLDPAYRGYTDLSYGVSFLYPANWIRPQFTPDGKRLFTADTVTGTVISLYPYTNVSSAKETAGALRESWGQLENLQVSNEREAEVGGNPAYVLDYTYTFNGQNRVGAVVAIYVAMQNVGYSFDLDAPADNLAPAQLALQALADSLICFEPVTSVGEWRTATAADGLVSFPVRSGWRQEASGEWVLFRPSQDESTFAAFAAAAASGQSTEAIAQGWITMLQGNETNVEVLASEPYYVGEREWCLVVFTYEDAVKMAGSFFVTSAGGQDYTFWLEAPDAAFDQLYADIFSVMIGGLAIAG